MVSTPTPRQMGKQKTKLFTRLMVPMMLLVMLHLATFFGILIVGGQFSYIRQYAYGNLVEKTENRRTFIANEFKQKMPFVQEYAERVNTLIEGQLREADADISDLQADRRLVNSVMSSSVDTIVELMRRTMSNDVFLILDTGDLYAENASPNAKAAMYLRDLDTMTDAGYEDLLMEIGLSSVSRERSIILDSDWSLYFEGDPKDEANDFYYTTIQTARENPNINRNYLGYWSGFAKPNRSASASMKYTMPLIASDGTVYGVLGIGVTENSFLSNLPANDFVNETACYMLGRANGTNLYDVITYSSSAFVRLLGHVKKLEVGDPVNDDITTFIGDTDINLIGHVEYMGLYNVNSPYINRRWALISVADKDSVLSPLYTIVRMLVIAAAASLVVAFVIVVLISRMVVLPITRAIKVMNANQEYNKVVRFQPSNIYELDTLTDAITQLQINAQDASSQVSQMIRIADIGLGTFMYDRSRDEVFVGQSLLNLLRFRLKRDEDIIMTRQVFLDNIVSPETRHVITEGLAFNPDMGKPEYSREVSLIQPDGSTRWLRVNIVYNVNKSIGIVQDITSTVMEKKRIEHERDYDVTTGLLNRNAYYAHLAELFRGDQDLKIGAFVMIDLDNLKYVNDTYGHDFGDDYIKTAATALKQFQRYGAVVSRLSGDEFNVCLMGFDSKEEIREIISEVRTELLASHCLLADGTRYKVRASMGVSWYPDDAVTYDLLMKYADFAMYTIKHATKGSLAEFDMSAYAQDSVLITGVEEMNRIIDERSIKYAFQSIIAARDGSVYGYEALMRPQSTIFQSPLEFLRTAKTSAKLYEVERLTWLLAIEAFKTQQDAGRIEQECRLFINSISNSVMAVEDADALEEQYPELLSKIVLEILESENINEDYTRRKISRMEKWHAQIALDDFGTGYNSEYALITLHPNIIKIDRSIISGCDKDVSRRTIIGNLVRLARTNNILVLAEGVETEEELRTVMECGIDLLQGYLFNRPLFEPQPLPDKIVALIRDLAQRNRFYYQ